MNLISDKKLIEILIKDNGERLVCIKDVCPQIVIKLAPYLEKENKKLRQDATRVREGVAKKLLIAQNNLPEGYFLMLRCGYRALSVQKKLYDKRYNSLRKENPQWNEEKLKDETSKFIAPLDVVPPHSTGGAIDISIVNSDGEEIDMGTEAGIFSKETYTDSVNISEIAKKNRKMLILVMEKSGFVNYPTEWWHWSYGDRYWAAVLKKEYSIYRGI